MDRFEELDVDIEQCYSKDLHSSMDRFEGLPVSTLVEQSQYLHSSMDRFEVCGLVTAAGCITIYIPVWIDLKQKQQF